MSMADVRTLRTRVAREGRAVVRERDQFGYVLILIVGTIILRAWAGDTSIGIFLSVVLGGLTLAFILHTCGVHRRLLIAVETFIVFAIIVSGLGLVLGSANDGHQLAGLFGIAIAFGAPVAIVRRIGTAPVITFRVVLGALAIYLLFGLAYSYLYAFIPWLQGEPFFTQTDAPTSTIYLYFSYITMATVGYGDYTPATDLGKMLAVSQALLGQLYLVSVVAVIVGNIGQVRRSLRAIAPSLATEAGTDEPDAGGMAAEQNGDRPDPGNGPAPDSGDRPAP
ncbi:MAG: potassium channel family protein [Chloroflexi bacterium]|nr:potassium channel family protein [Chloroflexota bacterium]